MPRLGPWLCAASLLLATSAARARAGVDAALARRILDGLGVSAELAALPDEALGFVEAHRAEVAPSDRALLRTIVAESFAPGDLRARVARDLERRLDPASAASAAAWLAAPGADAVVARGLDAQRAAACAAEERDATPTDPRRDALVQSVGESLGETARARRRAALLFAAMVRAANAVLPETRRLPQDELRRLKQSQHAALDRARDADRRALPCLYRGVDTAQLRAAAAFVKSPAGRHTLAAVDASLAAALDRAAEATALRIVDAFGTGGDARPLRVARAR